MEFFDRLLLYFSLSLIILIPACFFFPIITGYHYAKKFYSHKLPGNLKDYLFKKHLQVGLIPSYVILVLIFTFSFSANLGIGGIALGGIAGSVIAVSQLFSYLGWSTMVSSMIKKYSVVVEKQTSQLNEKINIPIKNFSKELSIAIKLLWISFAIFFLGNAWVAFLYVGSDIYAYLLLFFLGQVFFAVILGKIIVEISKGKNWARILYLIIFTLFFIMNIPLLFFNPYLIDIILFREEIIDFFLLPFYLLPSAIAIFILFKKSSAKYFK